MKRTLKNTNAKQVYYYWRVYQHYLLDNNLPDDSKTISVDSLIDFVENSIEEEERESLLKQCTEAY